MPTNPFDFGIPILEIGQGGGPGGPMALTNTFVLNLPINCVMAGQQPGELKRAMGLNGAIPKSMRGIFGE